MNKIYIDWEDFGLLIDQLAKKIKGKFDGIYGIPRGGLMIAVPLSHKLKLPLLLYPTKNSLVVDDISDTGKTLKRYEYKKIACLFSTDWTETKPDWYTSVKLSKKDWIVFPWENK